MVATVFSVQFKAVKPVGDRVLVKVDQEEKQTTGGVLLPTVARNKPTAGAIVSIGQADTVKACYQRSGCNCQPVFFNLHPDPVEAPFLCHLANP